VRDLQEQGLDVQISGYGLMSKYHADNECADLRDLRRATKILAHIIANLEL
jgi:acetylornithine deacetylase